MTFISSQKGIDTNQILFHKIIMTIFPKTKRPFILYKFENIFTKEKFSKQ
jgi:hypothetical protein